MKAPRLFLESVSGDVAVGRELALPVKAAHHAADVLRMRTGDALTLFTGRGGEISTTIVRIAKRAVTVRVDAFDTVEREAPFDVTLVQALAANDAMDYALRKAVELGAAAVQPLTTARSARWPAGERGAQRLARWQQVAIAACEQCGRNRVPAIHSATTWGEWLAARDPLRTGILLAPESSLGLAQIVPSMHGIDIAVGPEGGFADDEIAAGVQSGLIAASLGPRVLRTETAGIATLAALHALWGDFR